MQVLKSGKNPTMRHLNRTHRVNLAWLSQVFMKCDQVHIAYCNANEQAADLLTKGFTNPQPWERVRSLIGIVPRLYKRNITTTQLQWLVRSCQTSGKEITELTKVTAETFFLLAAKV
eukprot:15911046-Heterocapsa_arctica.AAC.1